MTGKSIGKEKQSSNEVCSFDLLGELPKASLKRSTISAQLISGHMRIDLGRPMAKGNFIVFKGPSNKGKTSVAYSTIKHFLEESNENRAIYISSS